MKKARGSPLPTHVAPPRPAHRSSPTRRQQTLAFDLEGSRRPQSRWAVWWRKLTTASTGSPSDGMHGTGSEGSASVAAFMQTQAATKQEDEGAEWSVEETIVNREDREEGPRRPHGNGTTTGSAPSQTDAGEDHLTQGSGFRDDIAPSVDESWSSRGWRAASRFFWPRFDADETEEEYRKLQYYGSKRLLFFLYLNWILYLILNHSVTLYEKITYYGALSFFTLPLPIFIIIDLPQKHPVFFQIWLSTATWLCGITEAIQTKKCGFFNKESNTCHGKDFLAQFFYTTGVPTLILFAHGGRLYHAIWATINLVLLLALIIPVQSIYARNVVSFFLYTIFIQGFHYSREKVERRMFLLNNQLKSAYKAQQKAQISESAANQAKRRFASYIFHEVRVPLNTAMLAFQNLSQDGVIKEMVGNNAAHALEVYALDSSLIMMQTVLNDVLDLQRMDAGKFENNPRPFNLHRSINSMLSSVRVGCEAKNLGLSIELDPLIDQMQLDPAGGEGLVVVGDVIRLQQIVTNLASNAVKFSQTGEIKVTTRLLPPVPSSALVSPQLSTADGAIDSEKTEVGTEGKMIEHVGGKSPQQWCTFRMEIHDSGPGIVRQIISLSDGRLGVRSKKGKGAVFWFELSYPCATAEEASLAIATGGGGPPTPPAISSPPPGLGDSLPPPGLGDSPPMPSPSTARTLVESPKMETAPELVDDPIRALVVDDDLLTRRLFSRMLERLGAVVETASDGQECVDVVLAKPQHTFDLICLDNSMPVMNGEDAVRTLREAGRVEYVVGCTGNALTEDQQSYLHAGADRIIPKPLLLRDVKAIVETAAERKAARRKEAAVV
ncbi:hypothetical protein MNV49_000765 [Pseudohyphozyma bogoriensis]|nr:hypothetical protein MNV49_000765 [Pseudohyphozyma bogoriensis]